MTSGVGRTPGYWLTPEGRGQIPNRLLDVGRVQTQVLVQRVAGQDWEFHPLYLLEVTVRGGGDDRVEAVPLQVRGKGFLRDAAALANQHVVPPAGGELKHKDGEDDAGKNNADGESTALLTRQSACQG